jgi:GT2 family glycosyltransferase
MIAMDHISIVIVNYNAEDLTRECLKSLQDLVARNFKYTILVVDNGSQKPFKLTKFLQSEHVEVIRSESNLGFTGGNNLGITYAIEKYNSEYVCLLNNDTTVHPDFLEHLYKTLSHAAPSGMVSPKIYFSRGNEFYKEHYSRSQLGNVTWYGGGSIDWPNLTAFHRGVDEVDYGQFEHVTQSDFCTGCCVLISRQVLETVGLFDERLFLYFEDTDLSVRAQRKGYQILFCPEAVIWHDNAGSSGGSGSSLHEYYQTRNRIYFGLKHGTNRIRLTTISFAFRTLLNGNSARRKAVVDIMTGNLGKEAYDRI